MSSNYDILLRFLSDKTFIQLIKLLSNYEIISDIPLSDNLLIKPEERMADRVFYALDAKADLYILHIELQTSNHSKMHQRMYEYSGLLYRVYGIPVMQICIYIGEEKMTMQDGAVMPLFTYRYLLIDLKTLSADEFINAEGLEMNVLALLTNYRPAMTPNALFERLIERIATSQEIEDSTKLKNILDLINIFSKLRLELVDLSKYFMETLKLRLTRDQIKGTYLFTEGKAEGKAEGKVEGLIEGEYKAKVQTILKLYMERKESAESIAAFVELPIEEVKEIIARYCKS